MQRAIVRRTLSPGPGSVPKAPSDADFELLHPLLQRIYQYRGVSHSDELKYALAGLQSPVLKGLDKAVELISQALHQSQSILIIGDFDADGATSTAVALRAFHLLGHHNVDFLVPNRFEFGYGLTPEIVGVAAEKQPDMIITVDNGISSIDGVAEAKRRGIKVVITDHHLPADQLPAADAIVNPNQPGCEFGSKHMAGVGVIFYVMSALRSHLIAQEWFGGGAVANEIPKLTDLLDLVALGTVADVVRLDHNNRILVAQGLARIRSGCACAGIRAVLEVAGRQDKTCQSSDLGFIVGPRLNAAGRLEDMSLGIRCLLSNDETEARDLAHQLDQLNRERRAIEATMQAEALVALEALPDLADALPSGLCFYHPTWHQGVIGIVASRLKERVHRPVIVFAPDRDGMVKGSGRSVPQVHLRDVLDDVARSNPGLLTKFGGHAMAAGLSLMQTQLPEFEEAFADAVSRSLAGAPLDATISSDGEVEASYLSLPLAEVLQGAGPWGQGFTEPTFDGVFKVLQHRIVGEKHLKLVVAAVGNAKRVGAPASTDAIAFNVDPIFLAGDVPDTLHLVYRLGVNDFRGNRSLQLMVEHICHAR